MGQAFQVPECGILSGAILASLPRASQTNARVWKVRDRLETPEAPSSTMRRVRAISLAVGVSLAVFVGGFLAGRRFPAHHYERLGSGPYLFDTATGRACNPLVPPGYDDNAFMGIAHSQDPVPLCGAPSSPSDGFSYGPLPSK